MSTTVPRADAVVRLGAAPPLLAQPRGPAGRTLEETNEARALTYSADNRPKVLLFIPYSHNMPHGHTQLQRVWV